MSLGGSAALTPQLDVLLPAGHLTLRVTVEDRFGASASATAGATVRRLPVISTAVVDSVLSRAAEKLQSGDPQAATQASAALLASANAREAEEGGSGGGSGLDATQAAQMREAVLEIVISAAAATAPSAAAFRQTAAAVEAVVEVVAQVSEVVAQQATQLVGAMVNASLGIAEPLAEGTNTAVAHRVYMPDTHRSAASSTSNCRHERCGGARGLVNTLGGRAAHHRHRFCRQRCHRHHRHRRQRQQR